MRLVFRLLSGAVLLVVVFLILVVVIAPYTFLPNLLENTVASALKTRLGASTPPAVSLDSDPQWRMLAGDFSDGTIELGTPEIEGIRPDSVRLDLDPFQVDVFGTISSGAIQTEGPVSGTLQARFSEASLTELAAMSGARYPVEGVAFEGERMVVETEADVLGVVLPVSVLGRPDIEGNAFVFRPEEVRAMGIPVPDGITQSLLAGTNFQYPLGELPYGISMDEARIEGGKLVVTGNVPNVTGGVAAQ